jgi:hypothetical protein
MGFNIPNSKNLNNSNSSTVYSNWDDEINKPEFNSSLKDGNDHYMNGNVNDLINIDDNISIGINQHNIKSSSIIKNPFFKDKKVDDQTNLLDL